MRFVLFHLTDITFTIIFPFFAIILFHILRRNVKNLIENNENEIEVGKK